ncbi:MAG: Flavodoxin reductases (ferredoxin-NADPH reductases) family 1 [uncultured Pyrinomonadaceae bacterium]|uniref:Flavodoxin reductases (Ferredoxin-NADPH reductases) family 1 n=1 Tax=uncultured Pyrinomonadaceae bacterium TaxID=2283094 RepID=A0A6J4Q3Z6_9BACT|nr:MAG: Flavodoxin reductases (ferredoxin-NADPH reductases) family 1 [uncultured Pyrinomonadaceae bacterium]
MHLSEINTYPIKSLGGVSIKKSIVENRGLQFDRRWMLIDEQNRFLTQRNFPKMATVAVKIIGGGLRVLSGSETLDVSFEPATYETSSVKIWSSRCRALIYEEKVNEWFSDVLETNCRLVLMPEETIRRVNYFYAVHRDDAVSFADAHPFLLAGENSLADLNARLDAPVSMNRFRANFVVSDSESFAEDDWKKIKIGECVFHVVKPCARCVVTTIDQNEGIKTGVEPLKTLATYRIPKRSVKKKILFGQYLIAENAGAVLNVGDKIEVVETKNSPEFR